jgi:antirestriction protein ArdC
LLIIAAYAAKGIDAHPRVDVFTFNAWMALHRHVRKGEHGIHVATYAHKETIKPDGTTEEQSFPTSAVVFHVSQTDPDQPQGE